MTQQDLNTGDREYIADLILRGEPLPADLKYTLFPLERLEYELVYDGKEREEDIVANTMAVPLQPVREFGQADENSWRNELIFGDNLQAMKTLLDKKRAGELVNASGQPGVQLIYIDPPFASDRDFVGGDDERAYRDKIVGAQFLEFLRKRLVFLRELLSEDGSIFVHLDSKKGHYAKLLLDEIFGERNFRNEIVWHYYNKFQGNVKRFASDHDVIFWYSKSSTYRFKPQQELRAEGTVKQMKRVWDKATGKVVNAKDANGKTLYQETNVKTVDDVWRLSMLQPADKTQNLKYPTQKPESILDRIISATTEPGDLVLDAFAGSGTTPAVAEKLGRRWIAIDSGKLAIYTIQKRMLGLRAEVGNKGAAITPRPFRLSNAGLYDFARLRKLPWNEWRFFALSLFNCTDEQHSIAGVQLDGYKAGSDVLVFDHTQHGGVVLDHGFVDDLHSQIGSRVGSDVFIVAPAASVVFLEDYIDKGETRYYILRIPYSIINELHARPFEAIRQPISEAEINRTVDAVGFDFIKQPVVECEYLASADSNTALIKIARFESEALTRDLGTRGNRETLAAVLVDYDYPFHASTGSDSAPPFVFDRVNYAGELSATDWTLSLPASELGEHMMIIYLDIYGNEFTEIKSLTDFGLSPAGAGVHEPASS
ncbi:site-specific DNA-methyltransferase [Curtobacterium sp. MCBD17_003]|uniref:site-specific DNA-methyltransferase n=1 Tax=Curtobacterium sp. MCBD17_003 TaxID=2175667 RepID=UPI000DA72823|nr:site-specific DNA-methyltransferase [Curtobacterium sp. MCBD17_003]WIE56304.1 site-specific DNA-methyltransferase [Curtobacterium sp. MCBD17_003]